MKIFKLETKYTKDKKFIIFTILNRKYCIRVSSYKEIKEKFNKSKPKQYTIPNKKRAETYISIAAIYKNEPDIVEWIEYHKLIRIERFYLYDNGSTDNSKELLKKYIEKEEVIYHNFPGKAMQLKAYQDAIFNYKNETKWLAIIDLDEYIVPVKNCNIKDVLKHFENHPAIGINWNSFDSNDYINRPNKLVIEAYTRALKDKTSLDKHIKSIVNPKKVLSIANPHYAYYKGGGISCEWKLWNNWWSQ